MARQCREAGWIPASLMLTLLQARLINLTTTSRMIAPIAA